MTPVAPVPHGFEPAPIGGAFATLNGPLYAKWMDSHLVLGMRVDARHVNPGQACHGGMLATFADIQLSTAAHYQADIPRQFLPTISLQMDFLASAPLGSWLEGRTQVLRVTKNLLFSQAIVSADGVAVVRASGVFRRGPLLPDSTSDSPLTLRGMPLR